jgi:predicted MPP superfamily phosphohydrolase
VSSAAIRPQPDDTLVFLGDYVDRGPDSRGVLNQLIELSQWLTVLALMGNHEESMLAARKRPSNEGRSSVKSGLSGRNLEKTSPKKDDLPVVLAQRPSRNR